MKDLVLGDRQLHVAFERRSMESELEISRMAESGPIVKADPKRARTPSASKLT